MGSSTVKAATSTLKNMLFIRAHGVTAVNKEMENSL